MKLKADRSEYGCSVRNAIDMIAKFIKANNRETMAKQRPNINLAANT